MELGDRGVVTCFFLVGLKVDHGEIRDLREVVVDVARDPIEKRTEHLLDDRIREPRHLGVEVGLERVQGDVENRALDDVIDALNRAVGRAGGASHME